MAIVKKSAQNGGAENQPPVCYFKILPLPSSFPWKIFTINDEVTP
jgi:hypothetical protein